MTINFNVEPYNDDYIEGKKFYKILFKPGYAVQARELTQIQTIVQKQVERLGDGVFKNGSMVVPGQVNFDNTLKHVKLQSTFGSATQVNVSGYIDTFVGKVIVGETTGVRARVLQVAKATSTEPTMLFIKYISSNDDIGEFALSETLTTEEDSALDSLSVKVATAAAFGTSSGATITDGVFYINGYFVYVNEQTIILSKFSHKPTFKVGLTINESIVDAEEDSSLLDNAIESYNALAPGADRYTIDAILTKKPIDFIDTDLDNFIELLRVDNGNVVFIVNKADLSTIGDTLARRTFDESGHYTVRPFSFNVREYRSNRRGTLTVGSVYLINDIIQVGNAIYVAKSDGVSTNSNPLLDSGVIWQLDNTAKFNNGVHTPTATVTEPLLNDGGFVYNEDGSYVKTTRNATIEDHKKWESKLSFGVDKGKAYVYGYEIEKLNTTYIDIDKARDYALVNDNTFSTDYGNYILVKNLHGLPDLGAFPLVNLYNRYTTTVGQIAAGSTLVGTARIRSIQWDSGDTQGSNAVYKVFLFDINMLFHDGKQNPKHSFNFSAKQLRIAGDSDARSFTADTFVFPEVKSGNITFTAAGSVNTITGQNTLFLTEFSVGDYIFINGAPNRITSIANNLTLSLATAVPTQQGVPVIKCSTMLNDGLNKSLLFKLPHTAIKNVTENSYYITQHFASQPSNSSNQLTLTISGGVEFANPNDNRNYTIVSQTTGLVVTPLSSTRAPNNQSITFNLPSGNSNVFFDVVAVCQKDLAVGQKIKTVAQKTVDITTKAACSKVNIGLGEVDVIRVKSVMMRSGAWGAATPYSIDITNRFTLNSGQTESYYGCGFLTLKSGQSVPTNSIRVVFEYYQHSVGDFFTVNSYPNFKDIGSFESLSLRDCIDFRPKADSRIDGILSFSDNTSHIPKFGEDVLTSYAYYLPRSVKISLNKNGNIDVIYGSSDLNTPMPKDSNDGMTLFTAALGAYTFDTSSNNVSVSIVDNKRYTMRDIGKLEQRIDNLEYYTTLSLLEQDTNNMTIVDNDGLNMFKNGFIVDSFKSQVVGDVNSEDYRCSLDMERGTLRPFYTMDSVDFIDAFVSNTARTSSGYRLTGDVVTLPYTEKVLVDQPKGSSPMNINPFAVFTFIGSLGITPSFDKWFETKKRPDIIIDKDGNYSAIQAVLERLGVLGTVWNAWETQWSGTDNKINHQEQDWGFGRNVGTSTTTTGLTRTGVTTSLTSTIDYQTADDKIVSTAVIPYCRSRNILVQARGLKPNTRFYPFFDEVDISSYCTPASKLTIAKTNSINFDTTTNVGSDSLDMKRMLGANDPTLSLNIGDTVVGSISGTTAVVVGHEVAATGQHYLYVSNTKKSDTSNYVGFAQNDVIVGSISGATASIQNEQRYNKGGSLTTNSNGDVSFLFKIPSDSLHSFRTGTRTLSLLDIPRLDLNSSSSNAVGAYSAEGYLQERQQTVYAVRNATVLSRNLSESTVTVTTKAYDPLAQSFYVEAYSNGSNKVSSGCFITSIDIFFQSKDASVPVTLQLRPMVNGYPSANETLAFGTSVKYPKDVTVSGDASVATRFVFESPVYVKNETDYCVVLLADSISYKVWVSVLGEKDTISKTYIDKQPSLGSLFTSQNASTWNAEQNKDLKMKINRAVFNTSKVGKVLFKNVWNPLAQLPDSSLQFKEGSSIVKVHLVDHGLVAGSKTTLYIGKTQDGQITATKGSKIVNGVGTAFVSQLEVGSLLYRTDDILIGKVASIQSETQLTLVGNCNFAYSDVYKYANSIYGIPAESLCRTHTVVHDYELDSFTIDVQVDADQSGYGGESVKVSRNISFDMFNANISTQNFSETTIDGFMSGISGQSIDGSQIPYQTSENKNLTKWQHFTLGTTNECRYPMMVANKENTVARPLDNAPLNILGLSGDFSSCALKFELTSSDDTLSPVIDARSVNLICVKNKINKPSKYSIEVDSVEVIGDGSSLSFNMSTISIGDNGNDRAMASTVSAGQYITVSGSVSNNGEYLVTNVGNDGSFIDVDDSLVVETTANVKIVVNNSYFDETAPVGSSTYSKYVTRDIGLSNPSTFARVMFSAKVPTVSDIGLYMKTKHVGSEENFDTIEYVKVDTTKAVVKSNDDVYRDVSIEIADLAEFDACKFKLCLLSSDSTRVPEIKNLRIIVCA